MNNYADMSIEQLTELNIQLSNQRAAIRAEQLKLKQVLDRKIIERDAKLAAGQVVNIDTATADGKGE